jgi:hypothetical protein
MTAVQLSQASFGTYARLASANRGEQIVTCVDYAHTVTMTIESVRFWYSMVAREIFSHLSSHTEAEKGKGFSVAKTYAARRTIWASKKAGNAIKRGG